MSNCKVCGIELTPDNAYSRIKEAFIPLSYCIDCHKERERIKYRKNPSKKIKSVLKNYEKKKKFWLIRGERYTLIFRSQDERRSFTTIRRLQKRFGKPKTSSSSNFGRSIDTKVFKKTDDGKRFFVYERVLCEDPDCKGIVRFDDHGYQVCEQCGLIRDEFPYEQTYDLTLADQTANYNRNNLPVVDKYYSNAYKRRYS